MKNNSINSYEQLIDQAEQLFEQEKHQEALAIGEELMKNYPDQMMSFYVRGRARLGTKDYIGAMADLDKAIDIDPSFPLSHNYFGNALSSLGRFQESLKHYDRAIFLNPEYAIAYNNKGSALDTLKLYDEALRCYDRAIKLNPKIALIISNKGNSLFNLKRYDEAIKCYDQAIDLDPEYVHAHINKTNALYHLKRHEEALESYITAHDLDPDDLAILKNMAKLKEEMNRFDEALEDYGKYLKIKPDDWHVSYLHKQALDKVNKLSASSTNTKKLTSSSDDGILHSDKKTTKVPQRNNTKKPNQKKPEIIAQNVIDHFRAEENPHANMDISQTFKSVVPLEELLELIDKLYEDKEHVKLENRVMESNLQFKQFTTSGRSAEIEQPEFYVLRRWNSYTPIVGDDNTNSKGGGYFIHLGEHGIVIDPGFNFIENFKKHGFKFNQISKIFISHAHNDHTADLESIRTLLYIYNKDLKKDIYSELEKTVLEMNYPNQENMTEESLYKEIKSEWAMRYENQRKIIDIYLTASTFKNIHQI